MHYVLRLQMPSERGWGWVCGAPDSFDAVRIYPERLEARQYGASVRILTNLPPDVLVMTGAECAEWKRLRRIYQVGRGREMGKYFATPVDGAAGVIVHRGTKNGTDRRSEVALMGRRPGKVSLLSRMGGRSG